ncbi:MAG TPA: Uma2 family endonuclease, partial [Polyangiaceae bacterium]
MQPLAPATPPREDQVVYIYGAKWADYEALLRARGESANPRITFLGGTLEIMSPSENHEEIKSVIGRLVEVYCDVFDIEFTATGSWTLKKRAKAAAEPDESYRFGPARPHSFPDLVIEVDWSSAGMSKLEVYARLGIREVWYWRRGVVEAHVLRGA